MFEIGDKVRVKTDLRKEYPYRYNIDELEKYENKIMTIKKRAWVGMYKLVEDDGHNSWENDMLERIKI